MRPRPVNLSVRTHIVSLAALVAVVAVEASAQGVQLVSDPAAVANCQRLGEVRSNSLLGGAMAGMGYQKALDGLKKKAAKLGATHLQLLNATSGFAGSNMLGIAFKCGPEA